MQTSIQRNPTLPMKNNKFLKMEFLKIQILPSQHIQTFSVTYKNTNDLFNIPLNFPYAFNICIMIRWEIIFLYMYFAGDASKIK